MTDYSPFLGSRAQPPRLELVRTLWRMALPPKKPINAGSRDCPNFKVAVVFQAVGRPERDEDGRTTRVEDDRDVIVSISRPYLERTIVD